MPCRRVRLAGVSAADEDLARVTVISPTRRIDLALPGGVTLGELLPAIIRFSGHEGGTPQEAVHGWVLQRFGHDPLDPNAQISRLGIRDGEILHLRPREAAMPDVAFDDVVDAVSTTVERRPAWQPRHSRNLTLAMLAVILVGLPVGGVIIQAAEHPVGERGWWGAAACLVLSLAAFVAAVALSRAAGRHRVAATLSWSAVVLGGVGGLQLLDIPEVPVRLVFASALVLAVATACALAAGVTPMALFSVAAAAGGTLVVTVVAALQPAWALSATAIAAALLLAATATMPTWAYRIAQIHLPALPASADEIGADHDPVQTDIVARAVLADRLLSALLTAAVIDLGLFCLVLLVHGDAWQVGLTTAIGLALLMRARAFVGFSQKLVLALGGALITLASGLGWFVLMPPNPVIQAVVLVVLVAGAATALTHHAAVGYQRIASPTMGRWGDVIEWISVMSVVPLVLGAVGTYGWIQTLFTGA